MLSKEAQQSHALAVTRTMIMENRPNRLGVTKKTM